MHAHLKFGPLSCKVPKRDQFSHEIAISIFWILFYDMNGEKKWSFNIGPRDLLQQYLQIWTICWASTFCLLSFCLVPVGPILTIHTISFNLKSSIIQWNYPFGNLIIFFKDARFYILTTHLKNWDYIFFRFRSTLRLCHRTMKLRKWRWLFFVYLDLVSVWGWKMRLDCALKTRKPYIAEFYAWRVPQEQTSGMFKAFFYIYIMTVFTVYVTLEYFAEFLNYSGKSRISCMTLLILFSNFHYDVSIIHNI